MTVAPLLPPPGARLPHPALTAAAGHPFCHGPARMRMRKAAGCMLGFQPQGDRVPIAAPRHPRTGHGRRHPVSDIRT